MESEPREILHLINRNELFERINKIRFQLDTLYNLVRPPDKPEEEINPVQALFDNLSNEVDSFMNFVNNSPTAYADLIWEYLKNK